MGDEQMQRTPRVRDRIQTLHVGLLAGCMLVGGAVADDQGQSPNDAPAVNGSASKASGKQESDELDAIVVTGVRASERLSIDLKRDSPIIQDSIAAQDIGKLPDSTIADSLQRIPGVQIDRDAGEGTTVEVRGLPQVATLLNGETFLTTGTIGTAQPDFNDIPSQLFSGADVYKSASAGLLNTGITGTINLRTLRPFDLKEGDTASIAGQVGKGSAVPEPSHEFNGLLSHTSSRWGALLSVAYTDSTHENSQSGQNQYSGWLFGEQTATAPASSPDGSDAVNGFLNGLAGAPLPPGYRLLTPKNCQESQGLWTPTTPNGCNLDLTGDGKANKAFYGTPDFYALDATQSRHRLGVNTSEQVEITEGLKLTFDAFYTDDRKYDRSVGYQINNSPNWGGATWVPTQYRATGANVVDGANTPNPGFPSNQFYTVQQYLAYPYDLETYSENDFTGSISRNFNLELNYDTGGRFTGQIRALAANARQVYMQGYTQFAVADGTFWPNVPSFYNSSGALPPSGTLVYPGGNRVFNAYDLANFPGGTVPMLVSLGGKVMTVQVPHAFQTNILNNPMAYSLKTTASENDYQETASSRVFRGDGHFKFSPDNTLDFGLRFNVRHSAYDAFILAAPVWGGNGAYYASADGTGTITNILGPNAKGCYVRYKAADVVLDTVNAGSTGCVALNNIGYYRGGPLSAQTIATLPATLAQHLIYYPNIAGSGIGMYALDPKVMDNMTAFQNALYPGEVGVTDPANSWAVGYRQWTGYVQDNFKFDAYVPLSGNIGVKIVRLDLAIDQHNEGNPDPYTELGADLGVTEYDRSYNYLLPAFNLAADLTDRFKARFAFGRNMMPLDLSYWGGGVALNYAFLKLPNGKPIQAVAGGTENGNPDLKPWYSTNYDLSFEFYQDPSTIFSVGLFDIDISSFITNGTVSRCNLPDSDGVVRRCTPLTANIQGNGATLHGLEAGVKKGFDFLPGLWSGFGVDANYTFSPSNTGTDVAGNPIPFQGNSRHQANLILWYEKFGLQARVAANYRSAEAVQQNYGGIQGFEEYQAAATFVDCSLSYDFGKMLTVYFEGSNLTGESQHFYLVWPDERIGTKQFETQYIVGFRLKL
jgi:TonB-dependent receptor